MSTEYDLQVSPSTLTDKFLFARELIVYRSKKDPPNYPYKSKYEARNLLLDIEKFLLEQRECDDKLTRDSQLAIVDYFIANISYDVEEPSQGFEYASKCLNVVSNDPVNPQQIICYLSTLNVLGFSACKYDKIDESLEFLMKADTAYKSYKEKFEIVPVEFCEIFGKPLEEEENGLEKAYTSTLFYLAQVYSAKGDRLKSAKFCHTTLRRQLEFKEFEAIDWALNSATLSQYLIEQNAFTEARNHLSMAQILLEMQYKELSQKENDSEDAKAMIETLRHRIADVFRCWAKYGIYLMNVSKERLVTSEGDRLDPVPHPPEELRGLTFSGFEEDALKECECAITSDFLLTFEDAKPVFLKSQDWLNKAKEYYTLENQASDHISILQDSSQLYQLLAFFQPDETTQCKLHKRRLDMLDGAVNTLNPTYYLNVCRELWYELGEICLFMADIKRTQGEQANDQHLLSKSQQLYSKGINYFEKYLESFRLKKINGTIEKYPEGHEKSILMTYMFLGRMYSKLTSSEKTELVRTQRASLDCYRAVLEYCNVHNELHEVLPEEIAICKEMVNLIPLKISKIERYM